MSEMPAIGGYNTFLFRFAYYKVCDVNYQGGHSSWKSWMSWNCPAIFLCPGKCPGIEENGLNILEIRQFAFLCPG